MVLLLREVERCCLLLGRLASGEWLGWIVGKLLPFALVSRV